MLYKEDGILVRQIILVMELEKGINHVEQSFIARHVHNLSSKMKRMLGDDVVKSLLEYMQLAKQDNNLFQYS